MIHLPTSYIHITTAVVLLGLIAGGLWEIRKHVRWLVVRK